MNEIRIRQPDILGIIWEFKLNQESLVAIQLVYRDTHPSWDCSAASVYLWTSGNQQNAWSFVRLVSPMDMLLAYK